MTEFPTAPTTADNADEAARQLEAYFLRRILSEVHIAGAFGGSGFAGETFHQMFNEALADAMADAGGLGISNEFRTQLGDEALTARLDAPPRSGAANLAVPVKGEQTSGFGMRDHPISGVRKMHNGLDIAAPEGTKVRSAAAGVVVRAERAGGYGNLVVVEHAGKVETRYAHLSAIKVKVGDKVDAGTPIGAVGSTGRATGPHLHFEVRRNGVANDPSQLLTGVRQANEKYRSHLNPPSRWANSKGGGK